MFNNYSLFPLMDVIMPPKYTAAIMTAGIVMLCIICTAVVGGIVLVVALIKKHRKSRQDKTTIEEIFGHTSDSDNDTVL